MPGFSLVIEYLTGYAVATDPCSRERPEWPPHPARVFMAMAAAHFETDGATDEKRAERDALEWLTTLSPPELVIPPHTARDVLTVYVPVNDQGGSDALVRRSRQPRTFPRVHVGDEPVRMIWRVDSEHFPQHISALESVCRHVTRIGHSSSLVWVRLERSAGDSPPTLVPDEHTINHRFRVADAGALGRLESAFNRDAVDAFAALDQQIAVNKGAAKKKLKEEQQKRFPQGRPTSQRPIVSMHQGYRAPAADIATAHQSPFDANFIVLREHEDAAQTFGLESTANIAKAVIGLLMAKLTERSVSIPSWISGHEANGDPLQSGPHIAIIPLAFVGRHWVGQEQYADGHLLGLGLLIPKDISLQDRGRVLGPVLFDSEKNEDRVLDVQLGHAGVWKLVRETGVSPRVALRTGTYSGASESWASVTPVVLDRMPKSDRVKDPIGWREEVAGIISRSCSNVGLPEPISVRVEKTPFFRGSLRAMPGQGGLPQIRPGKFQVHVQIDFDQLVAGPLLLGAGRFRGYGLMRPWREESR